MQQDKIRSVLFLNALIALISCTGLSINLVAYFGISTSSYNTVLLDGFSWQCWAWAITFILSILVALVMSTILLYSRLAMGTRYFSFTPLVIFLVTLSTCIIFDDKIPWVDVHLQDRHDTSPAGLFFHCSLYGDGHENGYPTLYRRCVLIDITWLSGILICFLWLVLFCVAWISSQSSSLQPPSSDRSTSQSSIQFYKYYLPETASNLEQQPYTSHQPSTSDDTYLYNKDDNDMANPTSITKDQSNPVLFASTKLLPPLNLRSSEETLYLPIHSDTATTYTSCYDADELPPVGLLQPQEGKIEVSNSWIETFAPPFTTTLRGSNGGNGYTNVHSMDLGWLKRTDHPSKDDNDSGWISPYSRRNINALSCPGFNTKKISITLRTKHATDDTLLRY